MIAVRIAVIGAGGVGGYFGGMLARAGLEVAFLARGQHLLALQRAGLRVSSPQGDFTVPVRATDAAGDIGTVDLGALLREELRHRSRRGRPGAAGSARIPPC